jgi:glycosyltransferase involved in cell wall biosynthesis
MKVGILTYGLDRPLTGIGRYTIQLVNALSNLKDGPEITLLQAGKAKPLESGNFRSVTLPGCRFLPGLMTLGNIILPWVAHRLDLDVIHDPIGVAPFLFSAGRAKMVVTLHDVFPWSFPGTSTLSENIIYRQWLPQTIRRVHAVITPSEHSRRDILRFLPIPPARLYVLYEGIAGCFHPLPAPEVKDRLIERFRLSAPYLLAMGATTPRKNIRRLEEAFFRIAEEFPRARLVITGPPAGKKNLAGSHIPDAKLSGRILRVGSVSDSDLAALFNGCELFVFPSLYEGFGLPPLEAMACGAPVVCSNSSSLPEVVGGAALMVDPVEIGGLADAMRKMLSDAGLRTEMQKKGLLQARQFSWERNALETMAVYRKVVYH